MVDPILVTSEPNPTEIPGPRRDPFLLLWEVLRHPLLLVAVGGVLLVLVLAGMALPQLPGQYADDLARATRWLLTTRSEYGSLGALLNGLGLFDLVHSPLIGVGLALLGLLLLVHLGEQLADIQRSRRLPTLLAAAKDITGAPLPVPGSGRIFRSRLALDTPIETLAEGVGARLGDRFDANPSVLVRRVQLGSGSDAAGAGEMRWLVQGHTWAYYVRPLLLAGILLALAVFWADINFGWEVTPAPLAPGSELRFPRQSLSLGYSVIDGASASGEQVAVLRVALNDATQLLNVGRSGTVRLNNTSIWVQPDVPGIFLESNTPQTLLLPGQNRTTDRIGFVFPAAGSEESVLIPDADMGLRLVRLAAEGRFLVETIAGESGAVTRAEISQDETRTIPLIRGSRAGAQTTIRIRFLPGLRVRVRYLPGDGLLWAALVLILAGCVGYLRRPFFALVQLGPWPGERSLLVVQSSSPEPLAELERRIGV